MSPSARSPWHARERATQAPVMLAVRVPPSACRTSQSTVMVRRPSACRSVTEQSERPIRRWISCVRPPVPVRSREVRVWVARGSMPYSAVSQPALLRSRQAGTPSATEAAHSTRVLPAAIRHEPSA